MNSNDGRTKYAALIDFHVHFFPDKIAGKALSALVVNALPQALAENLNMTPATDGTATDTLRRMDDWGVTKAVTLSIATNERQTANVNNFAAEFLKDERIIPFASVFPGAENAQAALESIKAAGFKGIKLHPEYQGFDVADEQKAFPIYEFLEKNGLILSLHAGHDIGFPSSYLSPPEGIRRVADTFSRLKIVAAHLGGWRSWEEVLKYLVGADVYLDTSCTAGFIDEDTAGKIITRHGAEKILFGTDCPWSSAPATVALLEKLKLPRSDMELIYHKNAERLLKL
ncbi:MAG: amidohydrolase family protein [Clostridiaceae bacterium]|jgi:predicted TIM-barrel fold metal-dependent hydrolase|nr:amidohydrolase family protein [Clostridiaceae bacterium]